MKLPGERARCQTKVRDEPAREEWVPRLPQRIRWPESIAAKEASVLIRAENATAWLVCPLTMSLSGRPPTLNARCARTMIPACTARLLNSHGRSKRWLEGHGSKESKVARNSLRLRISKLKVLSDPLERVNSIRTDFPYHRSIRVQLRILW
jgi:hypothetical protein